MHWDNLSRIRSTESNSSLLRTLVEKYRHKEGLSGQKPLARSHERTHEPRLLLRAVPENGFHLDTVFHVHHSTGFGDGCLTGIKLHFNELHVIAENLVIHF